MNVVVAVTVVLGVTWVFTTPTTRSTCPAVLLGGTVNVSEVLFVTVILHGVSLMVTLVSARFALNPEPLMVTLELPFIGPVKLPSSASIVSSLLINGQVDKSHLLTA